MLNAVLSSCTGFRTYDESVSFHNKIVAESGMGSKRSVLEFPFRCSYKKLPLSGEENYLQPLYHHGQGNGVNKWLEQVMFNLPRNILLAIKRYIFRVQMQWGYSAFMTFICYGNYYAPWIYFLDNWWRWIVVDIYRAAKGRGKYPTILPTLRWIIFLVYTAQAE